MVTGDGDRIEAVKSAAELWADALIDLSQRNGLVCHKDTKTTTLDFTDANPEALSKFLSGHKTRLGELYPNPDQHTKVCAQARNLRKKMLQFEEEQGTEVGHVACGLLIVDAPRTRGSEPVPPLRAPLLLQPVTIQARTVSEADFTVELPTEWEPNPVLLYVLDRTRGITVDAQLEEQLRDVRAEFDDPRAQAKQVFQVLAEVLTKHGVEARFEERVVGGVFSYEKLPMVRDLRSSADLLAEHEILAALAGHVPAEPAPNERLASEALADPDSIPPQDELIVLDADASQQAAISAALSGRHVLIDGPPGTGKSQTIANVIACLTGTGKRVLFVSEKRAAIEAVTQRLEEVGLAHLVFDLHDRRVNRRHVSAQLAKGLERASREVAPQLGDLHQRLSARRDDLRRYVEELHKEHQLWQVSLYDALCQLQSVPVRSATGLRLSAGVLAELDAARFASARAKLKDFVDKEGVRITRGESAWARSRVQNESEVRAVLSELDELVASTLRDVRRQLDALVDVTGLPPSPNVAGWREILDLLHGIARSIADFGEDVFADDLDDLVYATADRGWRSDSAQSIGFWGRRELIKRARAMRRDGVRNRGALYAGLAAAASQRDRWRALSAHGQLPMALPELAQTMYDYSRLLAQLAAVGAGAGVDDLSARSAAEVQSSLDRLAAERDDLYLMPELNQISDWFIGHGLRPLLEELAVRDTSADEADDMIRWVWLSSVLDELRTRVPVLGRFVGRQHSRILDEYRSADQDHIRMNSARVRREVAVRLQHARDGHPEQDSFIRRQAALKARHASVRRLVEKAPDVLLALHPCWAMSPLVVSNLLPSESLFDTVVFDEASQIEPHDAVAAIMRGRQLIVAGDNRQLPPTNFFRRSLMNDGEGEPDDDEDPGLGLFESILDRVNSIIPQRHRLRWHYRSLDERLIAFSNKQIYDGELISFPGVGTGSPIRLAVVDGRVMPGQDGSAPQEVDRVVDLVLDHATQRPDETLGVIALSQRHADRIELKLRDARRRHPELAEFFSEERDTAKRFFIKNLERVQGDERDAIILTLGYAKNAAGKLTMRFGPLNNEGGERRLNVAITRARKRMTVVSSFSHHDMTPSAAAAAKNSGPELLRQFLVFADEHGRGDMSGRATNTKLNGFEDSVWKALVAAGVPVVPQWGVSDYRIDFALAHPDRPGQMVLALEADGDSYHRRTSVRDRDRLRQSQLERLGWRFCRVWSMDWYRDRDAETARIVDEWRRACADVDSGCGSETGGRPAPVTPSAPPVTGPSARGSRPRIPRRERGAEYTDGEFVRLCAWLLSDGLPMARSDRIDQAIAELRVSRRGKVVERLNRAFDKVQQDGDGGEVR